MPKRIAMVLALLMMSAAGFAQDGKSGGKANGYSGDLFLGYSLNHASTGWGSTGNLNGWEGSIEGKIAPWAGLVFDASGHYGTLQLDNQHITGLPGSIPSTPRVTTYLFGPRVSTSKGKLRPFAQGLVGVAHLHETAHEFSYAESTVGDAIGGGLDYHLRPRFALRVQGDLLQTRFHKTTENDIRMSTGMVFDF